MVIFIHRPDFVGMSDNPEDKEYYQRMFGESFNKPRSNYEDDE